MNLINVTIPEREFDLIQYLLWLFSYSSNLELLAYEYQRDGKLYLPGKAYTRDDMKRVWANFVSNIEEIPLKTEEV